MKQYSRLLLTLVLLSGVVVVLGACSLGEKAAEETLEVSTGGDVDIDSDGDSFTIETDEGSMTYGEGSEVPDDFPSDMPIYEPSEVTSSSTAEANGKKSFSLTFDSTGDYTKIVDYYKKELPNNGWKVNSTTSGGSDSSKSALISGSMGEKKSVIITVAEEDGEASFSIIYSQD